MSTQTNTVVSKGFTINDFKASKENNVPISMVTCYDYAFAKIIEQTGIRICFSEQDCYIHITITQFERS